jgi:hypothetical protein
MYLVYVCGNRTARPAEIITDGGEEMRENYGEDESKQGTL